MYENALHLATLSLSLDEATKAEQLLEQISLPPTIAERDPTLALDLSLCRSEIARQLALAQAETPRREPWSKIVHKRWIQVEGRTQQVLQQMARADADGPANAGETLAARTGQRPTA